MKEVKIPTKERYALRARHFIPAHSRQHTVIISPATGVRQDFYRHFAEFLSSEGFQTYTFDYLGIGLSRPQSSLRDCRANLMHWGEVDLAAVIQYTRERHPGNSLTLIGHSIGGQLIGATPEARYADNIVLIAAQTPYWKHYNGFTRVKVWMLWYVLIPLFTRILHYFPAGKLGLFEDLPGPAALQWSRWGKTRHYMFTEYPSKLKLFSTLRKRSLVYSFSDDPFAPREAVEDLLRYYRNLNLHHKHFRPADVGLNAIGHFSFFRKGSKEIFWTDLAEWLTAKAAVRESLFPSSPFFPAS